MKVRWKEHEIMGVTMLIVWQMVLLFVNMNGHSQEAMGMDFITPFKANGIPFGYWKNVLLPQIGSLLLMYVAYLLINLLILPSIKQISGKDIEQLYSPQIIKALAAVLFVSYLVAIGINILSFYARPHFFNYGGYQFLSLAGYNDKPLSNLFVGFQLKDDLLDAYGDAKKFGKQVGGDIIANKKTFLLIKSLERASEQQQQELSRWISLKSFDKSEKVRAVKDIYDALAIPGFAEKKINSYFKKGFSKLKNLKCSKKAKVRLVNFTEQLIGRES